MTSHDIEEYKKNNPRMLVVPFFAILALIIGFGMGILVTTAVNSFRDFQTAPLSPDSSSYYDQAYIDKMYDVLDQLYIGDLPSKEDMTYGMIKGLITSLDDRYTSFLTPEEATSYTAAKDPAFEGIGVTLRFEENYTVVETVLSGYPAEKAGFLAGDIIVEVDGEAMEGKFPSDVASKIRGKAGTEVKIKVFRDASSENKDFAVTRQKINVTNVNFTDQGEGIYRISISQFVDKTPDDFNKSWDAIVKQVKEKNPKGIIVDLRNNPGGYVLGVRHVLEEFFKSGTILMKEQEKDKEAVVYKDNRTGAFEDMPITVLVNEGSASASEIFASAIQDNERGKVVGKPTVGKGVEQQIINDFKDGSILILVFQKWLSPKDREISKESPIKPDFEVDYSVDDFKVGNDKQLQKAIELLKQ